jgi:hypothetical protein
LTKSKVNSILSNGLFKIPEEVEFFSYLSKYKPINSKFDVLKLIKSENFKIVPMKNSVYFGELVN